MCVRIFYNFRSTSMEHYVKTHSIASQKTRRIWWWRRSAITLCFLIQSKTGIEFQFVGCHHKYQVKSIGANCLGLRKFQNIVTYLHTLWWAPFRSSNSICCTFCDWFLFLIIFELCALRRNYSMYIKMMYTLRCFFFFSFLFLLVHSIWRYFAYLRWAFEHKKRASLFW